MTPSASGPRAAVGGPPSAGARVVVLGGGGHARVVIDVLRAAGWTVAGYTDPGARRGAEIDGAPCLGGDDDLAAIAAEGVAYAALGIGDNRLRSRLLDRIRERGLSPVTAVHPAATISPAARLGEGVVVMAGAVVNPGTVVEDAAVVNTSASVDHDCRLGRAVHVAPGARLAGSVTVGAETLVGVGAVVGRGLPLAIGEGVVIGSGSVVVADLPDGVVVAGNPARPLAGMRAPAGHRNAAR